MNIAKKIMPTALLVLSMLGLTASFPLHAQTVTTTSTPTTVITTTTTTFPICYTVNGGIYHAFGPVCGYGTAYTPPPACPNGTLSIREHMWVCTPTTTTTTTLPPVPCYDRNGAAQTAAWCAKRKRR